MPHLVSAMSLAMALAMLVCQTVQPARAEYERTHPPLILPASPEATAFYVEFRARDEVDGFGHSYVTLGSTDTGGRTHQTVVVGFLPKSADDDRLSKFGLPVTGLVGATRSDFAGRPRIRFRVVVTCRDLNVVSNSVRRASESSSKGRAVAFSRDYSGEH
jgi:hypothetical protein